MLTNIKQYLFQSLFTLLWNYDLIIYENRVNIHEKNYTMMEETVLFL